MRIKAIKEFESRKVSGKIIPKGGIHDIAPDWAEELIAEGKAIPLDIKFNPLKEAETRTIKPKKIKKEK